MVELVASPSCFNSVKNWFYSLTWSLTSWSSSKRTCILSPISFFSLVNSLYFSSKGASYLARGRDFFKLLISWRVFFSYCKERVPFCNSYSFYSKRSSKTSSLSKLLFMFCLIFCVCSKMVLISDFLASNKALIALNSVSNSFLFSLFSFKMALIPLTPSLFSEFLLLFCVLKSMMKSFYFFKIALIWLSYLSILACKSSFLGSTTLSLVLGISGIGVAAVILVLSQSYLSWFLYLFSPSYFFSFFSFCFYSSWFSKIYCS